MKSIVLIVFFYLSVFNQISSRVLKANPKTILSLNNDSSNNEGFCETVNITLPESLKTIINSLNTVTNDELKTNFIEAVAEGDKLKGDNVKEQIGKKSKYYKPEHSFQRIENWGSNRGSDYYLPKPEINDLVKTLFEKITKEPFTKWAKKPIKFSRTDLFHAHIVFNSEDKDIIWVFHAREYPNDLLKIEKHKRKWFGTDNLEKELISSSFKISKNGGNAQSNRRNFVYYMKNKKLCGVNVNNSTFKHLLEANTITTLSEAKVAAGDNSNIICEVNYFPNEYEKAFFVSSSK